jgi:hypothetical protein
VTRPSVEAEAASPGAPARRDAGSRHRGLAGMSEKRLTVRVGGGRRAWAGDLDRKPKVRQYLADDLGVLDVCDQAHTAAAARTGEDVDVEGAPHEVGPRPIAGLPGGWRERTAGRALVWGRVYREGMGRFVGPPPAGSIATRIISDSAVAPAGMGGENPVVEDKIDAGTQGGEIFQEFEGLEEEVAGAVSPRALQFQQDGAATAGRPSKEKAEWSRYSPTASRTCFCIASLSHSPSATR